MGSHPISSHLERALDKKEHRADDKRDKIHSQTEDFPRLPLIVSIELRLGRLSLLD